MTEQSSIRRVLAIRNDRVGDLINTLPALGVARERLPNTHITALVSPRTAELVEHSDVIDALLVDHPEWTAWQLARRLAAGRFDAALIFNHSRRSVLATWWAGIRVRVATRYKPSSWLLGTRHVRTRRSHPPIHEATYVLKFVECLLGEDLSGHLVQGRLPPPQLAVDDGARAEVSARLEADLGRVGPLLGVHPGSYRSSHNWPPGRYGELISQLAQWGRVVVTGGPGEAALLQSLRDAVPTAMRSRVAFYDQYGLKHLVALISLMDVLTVSNTGPMHLAGALDTPVVALFSPDPSQSQEKWAPLGPRTVVLEPLLEVGESPRITESAAEDVMCRIMVRDVLRANLLLLGREQELASWTRRTAN